VSVPIEIVLGITRYLLPTGLPLAAAWTLYLTNVLAARWLADRDAGLLPRVLRAGAFTVVVCIGAPAGGDAAAACLEHRETLGVCFIGRVETERAWSSGLDLQVDRSWSSVRVVPDSTCDALRGVNLSTRGWSPTPAKYLYLDIDYPIQDAIATPGNWYRDTKEADHRRTQLLDLGRCRLLIDGYAG
jgi:hypothetical protein